MSTLMYFGPEGASVPSGPYYKFFPPYVIVHNRLVWTITTEYRAHWIYDLDKKTFRKGTATEEELVIALLSAVDYRTTK